MVLQPKFCKERQRNFFTRTIPQGLLTGNRSSSAERFLTSFSGLILTPLIRLKVFTTPDLPLFHIPTRPTGLRPTRLIFFYSLLCLRRKYLSRTTSE